MFGISLSGSPLPLYLWCLVFLWNAERNLGYPLPNDTLPTKRIMM